VPDPVTVIGAPVQVTAWIAIAGSLVGVLSGALAISVMHRREQREAATAIAKAEADKKQELRAQSEAADDEADRVIDLLKQQRTEYQKMLDDREVRYRDSLADLSRKMQEEINRLDRRVDLYGCETAATGCKNRVRVAPSIRPGHAITEP